MLLATQREGTAGSGGALLDSAPAPSAETRQLTPASEATTSDSGGDAGAETASPAAGSPLDGPLAARMERWHPLIGVDGRAVPAVVRSTVVDAPVRVVMEGAEGLDGVVYQIARRRWAQLETGLSESVPTVVWESVQRALPDGGELVSIHAVIDSYQPEYIVRYETDPVLIRLYTSGAQIDDVEIEELPSPHR